MRKLILLTLLIAAFTTNACCSQKRDTLIFRKDTAGIKPYFDTMQFVDPELYAWHIKNQGVKPEDNFSFGKRLAIITDTSIAIFFSGLFYRTNEVRLPTSKYKTFYRFVWLTSLGRRHYIINMFEETRQLYLETKDLDARTVIVKRLSRRKLRQFERLLKRNLFWQTKLSMPRPGIDGSDWLLEGQEGDKYHFLYDNSPHKGEQMYILGKWMMKNGDAKPLIFIWHGKRIEE